MAVDSTSALHHAVRLAVVRHHLGCADRHGIVYIPFVMILLTCWKGRGSYGNVHDIALRSSRDRVLRRRVRGP